MKSGDLLKLALVGVGGYLLYNYLVQSGMWAQWFGGAAAPGAQPVLANAGGTQAMLPGASGVTLQDLNGGTAFKAGDAFLLTVNGAPNAPIMISAIHNGTNLGSSQLGTTDASGRFTLRGAWTAEHAGQWYEQISVGGLPVGSLNFSVAGEVYRSGGTGAIVPVPNSGPITAPIPSQSFGRGGGYGSGGYGGFGKKIMTNGYVQ